MNDLDIILGCLLIPIAYVLTYIAGKYDFLSLICKMLEEKVKEYEEKEKAGGVDGGDR